MVQQADKPSSSKPTPTAEDITILDELLSAGKRHYVCQELQLALDCFVGLCEKLSIFYGETADECAEGYLYYGKTLLELARLENGVLGHAIKEAPVLGEDGEESGKDAATVDDDDEELADVKRGDIRADVEHAMRDGNLYNDASTEEELTADEETVEKSVSKETTSSNTETKDDAKKDETPMEEGENVESEGEDVEPQVEDEEEDVSNMQLAWEMFELTVFICSRQLKRNQNTIKAKKDLAEAKYGLAQISVESEHYEEAVKDFTECLQYFTETLEDKNDRRLAEVNYNIALAYSFDKKFPEAIEKYKDAVTILETRIKDLESKVKEAGEKGGKDKASTEQEEWTKEINELRDLVLLDMMAKIEDAEEMKKQAEESAKIIKDAAKEIFSTLGTSSQFDQGFDDGFDNGFDNGFGQDKEVVHDITSKVRTKRKNDSDSDVESKKVKQTNATDVNDNGDVNGKVSTDSDNINGKIGSGDVNGNGHAAMPANGIAVAES